MLAVGAGPVDVPGVIVHVVGVGHAGISQASISHASVAYAGVACIWVGVAGAFDLVLADALQFVNILNTVTINVDSVVFVLTE